MIRVHNPDTVHAPVGSYSHAVEIPADAPVVFVSGQVALGREGEIPPAFAAQCTLAWSNLQRVLEAVGMGIADLVKLTVYMVRDEDLPTFREIRDTFLAGHHPATTLVFVRALARPEWLIEIEAVAARPQAKEGPDPLPR
jgi:enamine deaminase RidA (YjgF/YER057c/UK114 family)